MKSIKVDDLNAGERYSEPLYMEGEDIFTAALMPLKQKDIDRLKKWGIEEVTTEGSIIQDTEGSDTGQLLGQAFPRDKALVQVYVDAVTGLQSVFDRIRKGEAVALEDIDKIAINIYNAVRENGKTLVSFTLQNDMGIPSTARSSINCLVLSVMIGLNLNFPSHRLIHLALGALLHDVGMVKIPEDIRNKKGELTPEEIKAIRTHPVLAYKVITRELKYPDEIGQIALQHHERWDGKGYPRGLAKKNIVLGARIVSVADAFEAMISDRPFRDSMIGYTAMRQILNDNSRRFDSDIVKVFIKSMGIYPLGSLVLLSDSSIGKVVETHPGVPLRPVVQLVISDKGHQLSSGKTIDLMEVKDLFIARAIDPKSIKKA